MATIRLQRQSLAQPWGFRIHGGADFNQPIILVKVTAGSIAAQNGLGPGDQLIQIQGKDALRMRHKEAQDLIASAGNTVDFQVAKSGSSTWKPQVQVLGEANRSPAGAPIQQVTKTSLAKTPGEPAKPMNPQINNQAKPFSAVNQKGDLLVNNQYNTPINMYSEQSIAETLSAQSEVLAGGAIGVNFKKNEKKYNHENSEVYKMLQEVEGEESGRTPPPMSPKSQVPVTPVTIPQVQLRSVAPRVAPQPTAQAQMSVPATQLSSPAAPVPLQATAAPPSATVPVTAPQTGAGGGAGAGGNPNVCAECERLIVGVFVRIKDKNLHVDCFKCNTCGQSLKNIGYYNINNKLYCDVHAKTVARANPPTPGIDGIPSLPQAPGPAGPTGMGGFGQPAAPSFAPVAPPKPFSLTGNIRPQSPGVDSYASKIAPLPFHQQSPSGGISHVMAPKSPPRPGFLQQSQQMQQQQQVQQTQGGGLLQQYSTFESSQQSSYSTSSNVSSSVQGQAGTTPVRVTWPPNQAEGGGDVTQGSPQIQSQIQPQSLLQQVPAAPAPIAAAPSSQLQQFSTFGQSLGQQKQFQPVAPPKFQQKQVPYKPLSTLLAPAAGGRAPAPGPVAPPPLVQQTIPPPMTAAPPPSAISAPISIPPPTFAPTPAPAPAPSAPSGGGMGGKGGQSLSIRPIRGKGVLTQPGPRIAVCNACQKQIRGPFITANSKFYCPDHFKCATPNCSRPLIDVGFVEEKGSLHCEYCWESHLAPQCGRCRNRIKYECLNAIGKSYHPECFLCRHCNKPFGNAPFFLEDGEPYCDADWNELFTTKCYACGFPIEAGDRWVEAMNQNYHSQCFNCAACKKNLEGQSFFAKAGRPFCKSHAR